MPISKFTYIYLLTALNPSQTSKLCSVCFFRLQKLVVSPLSTTKICRVCIFLSQKFVVCAFSLQKFVVSASFYYKRKFEVCAFSLQRFVVSVYFHYKSVECAPFHYKNLYSSHFSIIKVVVSLTLCKNMYGLDGCELMGLDDKLAIAFIYNTAKQNTTNQHVHVMLHVNINTMPILHVVTLLLLQPQPQRHQMTPLTPTNTTFDNRQQ